MENKSNLVDEQVASLKKEIVELQFPEDAKGIYNTLNEIVNRASQTHDANVISLAMNKYQQGLKELKFLVNTDPKASLYLEEATENMNTFTNKRKKTYGIIALFATLLFGHILWFFMWVLLYGRNHNSDYLFKKTPTNIALGILWLIIFYLMYISFFKKRK